MAARSKTVKLKSLAAATKASVQAALGKETTRALSSGGTTAGRYLRDAELAGLTTTPANLAKAIAKQVRAESGFSVTPQVTKVPGGAIVGYLIPGIMKQ
jgi:hypothetical protein